MTLLVVHWLYTAYFIRIRTRKITKNIDTESHSDSNSHSDTNMSSGITTTITLTLISFLLAPYIHVIVFSVHSIPKYQTETFRKRTLYLLPLRTFGMTLMYVFFFKRMKGIFDCSIYSINKPIYKRFFTFSLIFYDILLTFLVVIIAITIELNDPLQYGHMIMIIICIIATTIEITLSIFLVCVALKRLNALKTVTTALSEENKNKPTSETKNISKNNTNFLLKRAATKIFLCTMVAAISTQISVLSWAAETRLYITQPPIPRLNGDMIINALCVILSIHYYEKQYKRICYPCIFFMK